MSIEPQAFGAAMRAQFDETRQRSLHLLEGLDESQMMGRNLAIVNPLRWEIGHVAWFASFWVLRHLRGHAKVRPDEDLLYDSIAIPHGSRWELPLPTVEETLRFAAEVKQRIQDRLDDGPLDARTAYFHHLVLFHEMMHAEAFTYTRQTHGYPAPRFPIDGASPVDRRRVIGMAGPLRGDAEIPGGRWLLGAIQGDEPFVFDNEKWAHPMRVEPFRIARAAVTNGEFLAFVEGDGYARQEFWSEEGWNWRTVTDASHPGHWRRDSNGRFERREFDRWLPLGEDLALIHVNAHEAEAFCRWAGRRLPSELEWEVAAAGAPGYEGDPRRARRRYPWGDEVPTPSHANLDSAQGGVVDVAAFPLSDSAWGCRQMMGNVWEWTSSPFLPYPGFVVDPYKDYSEPWMDGAHRVLRGGCWATRGILLRNTWRNFYRPDRRDVLAGFRTCALR